MIELCPCAAPPISGANGTWWQYLVASRSGLNRVSGYRQGKRKDVFEYLRRIQRRMEFIEKPHRGWREFSVSKSKRQRIN